MANRFYRFLKTPFPRPYLNRTRRWENASTSRSFFKVQKQIEVETKTLDEALTSSGCARHDYLKIDIEGAELEVLGAAPETVKELLAVKTEVSFVRQCLDQPLAHDVAKFFDDHKFELMAVVDSSHWRREGYVIDPYMSPENIRYSRGQLIHADFIFFRSLESLGEDVDAKIRLGLIALATGYFDHAQMAFESPDVAQHISSEFNFTPGDIVNAASRRYGRKAPMNALWRQLRGLVPLLRYLRNY